MSILVVDIGTSGLRAGVVRNDGSLNFLNYEACRPSTPAPGLVEFDAQQMADAVLRVCNQTIEQSKITDTIDAVGITNQRASTVIWSKSTGKPFGPAIGWQDLRTVGECMAAAAEHGIKLAPNQTATKAAWMLQNYIFANKIDLADVRIGTVDSYIAAILSNNKLHVTDSSNAAVTGLCNIDALSWSPRLCELLKVEIETLPKIVASSEIIGNATALPGAPPIAALIGDQQSSLVGQACITSGATKITFGTGGMLNTFTGQDSPTKFVRSEHGVYPIVAFRDSVATYWASEAIMLSAGTNLDWLCQDLQLISSPSESHELASQVPDSGGVVFVPALFGLGTPHWDYGARGTLLGITRGTNRAHIVRSVLEGIAHRGADMIDSVVGETKLDIKSIRIDGGMSRNPSFVQALANATGRKIEVSPITEATTLGAAYLAGAKVSFWQSLEQATSTWKPAQIVEPTELLNRAQWHEAVSRARNWIPALSSLDF